MLLPSVGDLAAALLSSPRKVERSCCNTVISFLPSLVRSHADMAENSLLSSSLVTNSVTIVLLPFSSGDMYISDSAAAAPDIFGDMAVSSALICATSILLAADSSSCLCSSSISVLSCSFSADSSSFSFIVSISSTFGSSSSLSYSASSALTSSAVMPSLTAVWFIFCSFPACSRSAFLRVLPDGRELSLCLSVISR